MDLPIETNNTDESTTHTTNQDRLPPRIVHRGSHQYIQILGRIIDRYLVMDHIPVEIVGSEQFTQIQTCGLLQEFGLGCMCGIIVEGDQHRPGQVDDLGV